MFICAYLYCDKHKWYTLQLCLQVRTCLTYIFYVSHVDTYMWSRYARVNLVLKTSTLLSHSVYVMLLIRQPQCICIYISTHLGKCQNALQQQSPTEIPRVICPRRHSVRNNQSYTRWVLSKCLTNTQHTVLRSRRTLFDILNLCAFFTRVTIQSAISATAILSLLFSVHLSCKLYVCTVHSTKCPSIIIKWFYRAAWNADAV